MNINVHDISTLVNIPICTSVGDIQGATKQSIDLQRLKSGIIQGLPHKKGEVELSMKHDWPIRHELVMIDGIAMKGRIIIMLFYC